MGLKNIFKFNWGTIVSGSVMAIIGFLAAWIFYTNIEIRDENRDLKNSIGELQEDFDDLKEMLQTQWSILKKQDDSIQSLEVDIEVATKLMSAKKFPQSLQISIVESPGFSEINDPIADPPTGASDSASESAELNDIGKIFEETRKIRETDMPEWREQKIYEQRGWDSDLIKKSR